MSRRRFENLDADRQKRLFDSAAEEFAAHGFDGASLNRILARSGMSKSSLYYYFDDKADLFTTLVERSLALFLREIGGVDPETLSAETFWSGFEALYARGIAVTERHAWLVRLGGMFYQLRDHKKGSSTGRLFLAARNWVTRVVERGQALGVIRTDLPQSLLIDATMALLETLDRWVVAHWATLSEAEKVRMPQQHVDLMRNLLGGAPPAGSVAQGQSG